MSLFNKLSLELLGVIKIKKDGQVVYNKKEVCKLKREYTSCKNPIINTLELKQEGDI